MSPLYIASSGSWVSRNAHFGVASPAWEQVHTGTQTLTISAPGTYQNRDFNTYVTINAASATAANPIRVKASRFRGPSSGVNTLTPQFLLRILNVVEVGAVIVETSLFDPDVEFDQLEAVRAGGKAIVRDNLIQNTTDGITCLFGANQIIHNLIRDGRLMPTTTQPDGKTHNDGVVLGGGTGDIVQGNTIFGWSNAAIFVKAAGVSTYGQILNAVVDQNVLASGGATLHVFKAAADAAITIAITDNVLEVATFEIYVGVTVTATITGNTHADGTPAKVTRPTM